MIKLKSKNIDKLLIDYPIIEIPLMLDITTLLDNLTDLCTLDQLSQVRENLGKAIFRVDTKEVITTVSKDYQVITHIDMLKNVEDTLKINGLDFELFDINEGGKNKNRVYVNYLLPSYKFTVDEDVYIPFIQAYSCYDKFLSYGLLTGLYRIDNESAFLVFDKTLLAKRRHLRGKLELTEDMIHIEKWISTLGELRRKISDLRNPSNSTETLLIEGENIIRKVIKAKRHRRIFKELNILPEYVKRFGNTKYALFVALSEYVTHGLIDDKKKRAYDRSRGAQIQLYNLFLK